MLPVDSSANRHGSRAGKHVPEIHVQSMAVLDFNLYAVSDPIHVCYSPIQLQLYAVRFLLTLLNSDSSDVAGKASRLNGRASRLNSVSFTLVSYFIPIRIISGSPITKWNTRDNKQ